MTDDLVKRLRDLGDHASFEPHMHHTAADRIEELEAKLAQAVEAMQFWSEAVEPDVDKAIALMDATLAELKGQGDE